MIESFKFVDIHTGEVIKTVRIDEITCSELQPEAEEILKNLPRLLHTEDEISFSVELEESEINWRYISYIDSFGQWHTIRTL